MFAGRARELDRLSLGLQEAEQGRTVAFALFGEPGIGKTRLATELSQRAQQKGFRVCWGRAWESGGAPVLWPWRQLLEAAGVPPGPELLESPARSGEFSVSDPEQARFAQFHGVLRSLKHALAAGPLLCVLDDLHAADLASIELATFVLRSLRDQRLFLLCTYRDREASAPGLRAAVSRLTREAEAIGLERLSAGESAAVVQEAMGARGDAVAAALYRATAGNPLFLVETLRSLSAEQLAVLSLEQLPVADGISTVVNQRAARLDGRQRELLGAASAIGREGELRLWAELLELPLAALEPLLEPLFATGLVARTGPLTFAFSHALVRDAIYLELSASERQRLHEQLARVLHSRVAAGERRLIEPRAHHALLAPALPVEQITAWVLEAASLLRARASWEAAIALLERALAVVPGDAPGRAELSLAHGWALGDAGQTDAMRECFRAVAQKGRQLRDPVLFARAVLGLGSHYVFGDPQTELFALLDEALAGLGDGHAALHARLTARKAAAMTPALEGEQALTLARAAVREVRSTADARAQLEVAVAAGSAMGDFEPADQRLAVNTELVRLARDAGEPVLELRGVSRLVTDHLELGDVARADAFALEREKLVQALQLPRLAATTPLFRSMRAMGAGEFALCEDAIAEVQRSLAEAPEPGLQRLIALHAFWLALLRDDRAAVEKILPEALRAAASIPSFPVLLSAAAHAQRGDAAAARRELSGLDARLPGLHSTMGLVTLAPAALIAGESAHARTAFELLQPRAHLNAVWGLFGLVFGPPVAMTLGTLACALGEAPSAADHFAAAHARAAATRAAAHAAWVCFHHGCALIGPLNDPDEGRRQLEAAASRAAALGMKGLEERAGAALGKAVEAPAKKGAPSKPPPAPASDELRMEPQGSDWIVRHGARQVLVPNMKGMPMLAELIAHPNREIHALELVGEGEGVADAGDSGELLDEEAKATYRARLRELAGALEDAEELGQVERAESIRSEVEALRHELSRAVGLGGRDRRGQASAERARIAARRRLRDAIARIAQADAELGDFLERSVRTGQYCSYAPERTGRRKQ